MTVSIPPARPGFAAWLRSRNDITPQFLAFGGRPDAVSLAGGLPAAELYPIAAVEEATRRALARHGSAACSSGCDRATAPSTPTSSTNSRSRRRSPSCRSASSTSIAGTAPRWVDFTRSSPEVIRESVRRLGRVIEAYVSSRPQLKGKSR